MVRLKSYTYFECASCDESHTLQPAKHSWRCCQWCIYFHHFVPPEAPGRTCSQAVLSLTWWYWQR